MIAPDGGLCLRCASAPGCVARRTRPPGCTECADFVGHEATPVALPRERAAAPRPRLRGLCTNCELRETCTYPEKGQGVWTCEDYR